MASSSSSFLLHLLLFLFLSTTYIPLSSAHNITRILADHPDFSTFNHYLSATHLAAEINRRKTITVLALDNAAMSSLLAKHLPLHTLKNVLSLHVLVDYFSAKKLHQITGGTALSSTVFQSTGSALGMAGFVNITDHRAGRVTFCAEGSDVPVAFVRSLRDSLHYSRRADQRAAHLRRRRGSHPRADPDRHHRPHVQERMQDLCGPANLRQRHRRQGLRKQRGRGPDDILPDRPGDAGLPAQIQQADGPRQDGSAALPRRPRLRVPGLAEVPQRPSEHAGRHHGPDDEEELPHRRTERGERGDAANQGDEGEHNGDPGRRGPVGALYDRRGARAEGAVQACSEGARAGTRACARGGRARGPQVEEEEGDEEEEDDEARGGARADSGRAGGRAG
ncbi:fasciclin-like arabinogalactan protein 2 [Iris pallida]|uniref:Fasciclin-like arabinogalactan protein 2 n=1 Tax=Iris pallida TaxID=29817 RepID=A0AAX6E7V4_IRIPA|nr:fasciclin-like arabinogalactan protein 2 [Iris pallida]